MGISAPDERLVILIPIFNDWESAQLLLNDLDQALASHQAAQLLLNDLDQALASHQAAQILLIDDGSSTPIPEGFARNFQNISDVKILALRRNLGHQRAIAVGLVFVYENMPCRAVVVMDGDGEDRPSDIAALLREFDANSGASIIFAARAKRLERPLFRFLYHVYRGIHWLLTGDSVRVGNFSIVPFETLSKLVVTSEIWYHYAAAVIRSRLQFRTIPLARGKRLRGRSKMNFIGLLLHGLSAFFVYGDIVGARLLVAIALLFVSGVVLASAGLAVQFTRGATFFIAGSLGIVLMLAILIALVLVFTVIGSRVNMGFLPLRDCPYFVNGVRRIYPVE
ncbi:MAG TPA: glycosyltransferase [Bryobacteraceae bacterium]|nr:glycosyltransferase [Bryobacteraceae bacterium]